MSPANLNIFPTGPYPDDNVDDELGDETEKAKEIAEELGQDFWVSTSEINKQVRENTFVEEAISIYNFKDSNMQVFISISSNLEEIMKTDKSSLTISPNSFESFTLTISGVKPIGTYRGAITLSGDVNAEIPVKIEIVPKKLQIESLDMEIELFRNVFSIGSNLKFRLNLENLLSEQGYKIDLKHLVLSQNGTKVYLEDNEEVEIKKSLSLIKEIELPEEIQEGEYLLEVEANIWQSVVPSTYVRIWVADTGSSVAPPV